MNSGGWQKMTNFGFKLMAEQIPYPKLLLGFDIGVNNSGVAISSSDLRHAYYLTSIKGDPLSKPILHFATNLILKHRPIGVIVGKPSAVKTASHHRDIDEVIEKWIGEMSLEHPQTRRLPFTFVDQAWTTWTAKKQLKVIEQQICNWGHLSKEKDLVDGMAAINILRRYLYYYNQK